MKKIFLLFISLIFIVSLSAQRLTVPEYGIKVGVNYSHLQFPQYNYIFFGIQEAEEGYEKPKNESEIGDIKAGLFIKFQISPKWHLSSTISYSQFNTTTKINRTFDNDTIRTYGIETNKYQLEYINLEPIFQFQANDIISLNIGPSVSYLLSNNLDKEVIDDIYGILPNLSNNAAINGVSDIDAGINFGSTLSINEHIDIEINLNIGVIELENIDDGYNRFTRSSTLAICYTF